MPSPPPGSFALGACCFCLLVIPGHAGLVSHYNFDDETATDVVGDNHAEKIVDAGFSADTPSGTGKSLDLTGDDYVKLPDTDFGIGETSTFTIATWMKMTSSERGAISILHDLTGSGGDRSGVTLGASANGAAFVAIIASTGDEFGDEANAGGTFRDITTDLIVPTGEWAHLAATLNGDDRLTVYVNGEPAQSYAVNPAGSIDQDGGDVTGGLGIDFIDTDGSFTGFGASGNGPEHADSLGDFTRLFYNGLLDDVAIWNRALDANLIKLLAAGTLPPQLSLGDTDGDGLPDAYEERFAFLDPVNAADAAADQDEDGLSNLDEFNNNTAPDKKDTDEDGLDDNIETGTGTFVDGSDTGTKATNSDTDDDGLADGVETNTGIWVSAENTGTDPHNPDTDEDGLRDGIETNTGTLVTVDDTGTDPHMADTDDDTFSDLEELARGSDPFDPESVPAEAPEGGLVSYWNFDDGTTVTDQFGTNNGTVIEGAAFSDSVPDNIGAGKSLDLSNEKAYVRIGQPSPDGPTFGIDETKSFTISMWVNYEASERGIVTIKQDLTSGGGDRSGLTLGIGGDNRVFVGIIASTGDEDGDVANSGPTFRDIITDQEVPTGEWAHLAATLIDDALVVYLNGEPAQDYSVNPGGAIEPDGTNISEGLGIDLIDTDGSFTGFGASGNGPEHGDTNGDFTRLFYDGLLDEVAIWNIGISAGDVQRLAAGESPLDISKIVPFRITDVQLDVNRALTLTWNSKSNGLYTLEESDDLIVWLELDDGIDSQGETTRFTLENIPEDVSSRHYRIVEQQ